MPIDTSIYGLLKPVEVPSILDSATKAANLSQLAMQQNRANQEMQTEDQKRKLTAIGNTIESLAGVPEKQFADAFKQKRAEMIQMGMLRPEDVPEEMTRSQFGSYFNAWRNSDAYKEQRLKTAQIGKMEAEAAKDWAASKTAKTDKSLELGSGLRKEWSGLPTTKATQDVAQSIERVRNAYSNPSAAGDLALIFSYMKMLDPGSTVREGEFANAQNAGGIPDKLVARYNQLLKGERLSEEQRTDFAQQAERMYGGQLSAQKTINDQYTALAGRYGVDPSLVMTKFPEAKEIKMAIKQEQEKPGFFARLFGVGTAQAKTEQNAPQFEADVIAYAEKHGISPEQAQQIKAQRTKR